MSDLQAALGGADVKPTAGTRDTSIGPMSATGNNNTNANAKAPAGAGAIRGGAAQRAAAAVDADDDDAESLPEEDKPEDDGVEPIFPPHVFWMNVACFSVMLFALFMVRLYKFLALVALVTGAFAWLWRNRAHITKFDGVPAIVRTMRSLAHNPRAAREGAHALFALTPRKAAGAKREIVAEGEQPSTGSPASSAARSTLSAPAIWHESPVHTRTFASGLANIW